MPYYPKSQIVTDLYTNGDEYINSSTQEVYIGYYYEISTGQKYTGKNTMDKPNILLSPILSEDVLLNPNTVTAPQSVDTSFVLNYPPSNKSLNDVYLPQFNSPLPTSDDYERGIFTRYFCKKNNEFKFLEVDQMTYNKLISRDSSILWSLYTPFSIQWKISTDEFKNSSYNQSSVSKIEDSENYIGFSSYIKNYSQYTLTQEELDQRLNNQSY